MLSFDNENKIFTIECDTCGESVDFEADNFKQGLSMAKRDKWIIKSADGELYSFCCHECKKRFIEMNSFAEY